LFYFFQLAHAQQAGIGDPSVVPMGSEYYGGTTIPQVQNIKKKEQKLHGKVRT